MISLLEKAVILAAVVALLGVAPVVAIRITDSWGGHFPPNHMIGGAMVAFAAGVWVHCSSIFARLGKGTPFITDPPKQLVTRGLYRYSRNPLYVAHVVFLLGWGVASGRLLLLVYAAAVAALFHGVIVLREEPGLSAQFGEDYVRYTNTVPRWIGFRHSRGGGARA